MTIAFVNGQPWAQQNAFNFDQAGPISAITSVYRGGTPALSYPGLFVLKNTVYAVGYKSPDNMQGHIYTCPINTDGTLGTWVESAYHVLSRHVILPPIILTKNHVFLLGSDDLQNTWSWEATCDDNGNLTSDFAINLTGLPIAGKNWNAAVIKDRLYLLGDCYSTDIYYKVINQDGSLPTSAWTKAPGSTLRKRGGAGIVQLDGVIHLLGGWSPSYNTDIQTVTFDENGVLGTWSNGPTIPGVGARIFTLVANEVVYAFPQDTTQNSFSTYYTSVINPDKSLAALATEALSKGVGLANPPVVTSSQIHFFRFYSGWQDYASFVGGVNDPQVYAYVVVPPPGIYVSPYKFQAKEYVLRTAAGVSCDHPMTTILAKAFWNVNSQGMIYSNVVEISGWSATPFWAQGNFDAQPHQLKAKQASRGRLEFTPCQLQGQGSSPSQNLKVDLRQAFNITGLAEFRELHLQGLAAFISPRTLIQGKAARAASIGVGQQLDAPFSFSGVAHVLTPYAAPGLHVTISQIKGRASTEGVVDDFLFAYDDDQSSGLQEEVLDTVLQFVQETQPKATLVKTTITDPILKF